MSLRRFPIRVVRLVPLIALLLASGAWAQATIHGLARGTQPLEEATGVQLKHIDSSIEPVVRVGMELQPGDRLSSGGDRVDVELQCPGGSVLRFTGSYRVFIDEPGDGVDCAVNFLSGTVDVLTDKSTEIESGGVTLGSEGTQYSVSVSYRDRRPDVRCQVYDGRVEWRFSNQKSDWLSAGSSIRVVEERIDVARISPREVSSAALRYARFDVADARASGLRIDERAAVQELSRAHEKVLAQPRDTDLRVDLAKAQLRYSLSPQAVYNLRAVGVESEEKMKLYRIDTQKLRPTGGGAVLRAPPSGVLPSRPPPPPARDPWTLVEQKQYEEAIELGKSKITARSASSRDLCAMAIAYRELEGSAGRSAAAYAQRAVRAAETDGQLTESELRNCRNLARTY